MIFSRINCNVESLRYTTYRTYFFKDLQYSLPANSVGSGLSFTLLLVSFSDGDLVVKEVGLPPDIKLKVETWDNT